MFALLLVATFFTYEILRKMGLWHMNAGFPGFYDKIKAIDWKKEEVVEFDGEIGRDVEGANLRGASVDL